MLKTVIAKAGLKKEEFKTVDKQVLTCNKQRTTLDEWVDININFEDKQVYATIYVKIEAPNPLLLSEAVCKQLGIVQYCVCVYTCVLFKKPMRVWFTPRVSHVWTI